MILGTYLIIRRRKKNDNWVDNNHTWHENIHTLTEIDWFSIFVVCQTLLVWFPFLSACVFLLTVSLLDTCFHIPLFFLGESFPSAYFPAFFFCPWASLALFLSIHFSCPLLLFSFLFLSVHFSLTIVAWQGRLRPKSIWILLFLDLKRGFAFIVVSGFL